MSSQQSWGFRPDGSFIPPPDHVAKPNSVKLIGTNFDHNPMVDLQGAGPDGAVCKNCRYLINRPSAKNYYKCTLRGVSGGPGTDHRVRWPACGRYDAPKFTDQVVEVNYLIIGRAIQPGEEGYEEGFST
ncbi:MAG: hypothetical protein WCS37_22110 [Chloroflexota bacterium]|nr:hypothetical protein [Chloroflexota bacterium]